jgi:NADH-quinone oxidoreductase subunit C
MSETPDPAASDDAAAEPVTAETSTRHGAYVGGAQDDGIEVLHAAADTLIEVAAALRDEGYGMLLDVTAVDYLTYSAPRLLPPEVDAGRFEVVIHLLSHRERTRVRIRVQVDDVDPVVPSLFDLYPGAENMEREVFDMFGIRFENHPDMTRVLMPEDWVGHPLRKDYAIGSIPVQFKAASNVR